MSLQCFTAALFYSVTLNNINNNDDNNSDHINHTDSVPVHATTVP